MVAASGSKEVLAFLGNTMRQKSSRSHGGHYASFNFCTLFKELARLNYLNLFKYLTTSKEKEVEVFQRHSLDVKALASLDWLVPRAHDPSLYPYIDKHENIAKLKENEVSKLSMAKEVLGILGLSRQYEKGDPIFYWVSFRVEALLQCGDLETIKYYLIESERKEEIQDALERLTRDGTRFLNLDFRNVEVVRYFVEGIYLVDLTSSLSSFAKSGNLDGIKYVYKLMELHLENVDIGPAPLLVDPSALTVFDPSFWEAYYQVVSTAAKTAGHQDDTNEPPSVLNANCYRTAVLGFKRNRNVEHVEAAWAFLTAKGLALPRVYFTSFLRIRFPLFTLRFIASKFGTFDDSHMKTLLSYCDLPTARWLLSDVRKDYRITADDMRQISYRLTDSSTKSLFSNQDVIELAKYFLEKGYRFSREEFIESCSKLLSWETFPIDDLRQPKYYFGLMLSAGFQLDEEVYRLASVRNNKPLMKVLLTAGCPGDWALLEQKNS